MTLPGHPLPGALLVTAISPRKALEADYRTFLNLVAQQVATSFAEARAYEEERMRAQALAALDRAKTAFFSDISHEFRTPLTLMLGPLEELLAGTVGFRCGRARRTGTCVHRNAVRLLKLVNTLLDFARIEAGRVQAVYEPTDVAHLTAELVSVFRSTIERAGLRLRVECAPLPEPAYVDREMWEKIVFNLLSNAFKFTFTGEIAVRVQAYEDRVELSVRDTGTGIPAAELPHLFERFYRVRGARGRTQEGTGIGLALVHELVKLHGGVLRADSIEGQGSTFTIAVPRGSAHLPADRISAPRTLASTALGAMPYVQEARHWLPEPEQPAGFNTMVGAADSLPPLPFPQRAPQSGRVSGARVLVADDNADMRAYLTRLLQDSYEVDTIPDGDTALAAVRQALPDLVLADVMMPGRDGFELLRALRADPRTKTIPVLLLSARAGEEARVEGLEAGADDYIVKPFSARELLARMAAHLELSRLRHEATRREQELRAEAEAARDQVTQVLEKMSDGFFTLDREWRIVAANAAAERFIAQPRAAVLGKNYWEVFPIVRGTHIEQELRRAMEERVPVAFEALYEPQHKWFEARVSPLEGGGLSAFFRDITERKQAETAQGRYRDLVSSVPAIVWEADPHTFRFTFVNPRAEEILGYPLQQ